MLKNLDFEIAESLESISKLKKRQNTRVNQKAIMRFEQHIRNTQNEIARIESLAIN